MVRLVTLGLMAAAFFSSTFVLNRSISLGGGDWVWTASLRYGWTFLLLCGWLVVSAGPRSLLSVVRLFRSRWQFWLLVGTVGCGFFYAPLCFAAAYAPAWVIASTWQFTILATPIVLLFFGKKVPLKGVLLSLLIFIGILLVNLEQASLGQASAVSLRNVLLGVLPVLLSAVAYPVGNQLVGEAKTGGHRRIPKISDPLMSHAPARVLLMTIGSIPFWLILILLTHPSSPAAGQLSSTALIALLSGVIASSLFLHARHSAIRPYEIAAVDATQAGEAIFSLVGEILFLSAALPHRLGIAGLVLIVLGIILYTREQSAG